MTYNYDRRATEYGVGFTWPSPNGTREIVEETAHPQTGLPVFLVSTGGSHSRAIIPKAELAREVKIDTSHYESRQRALKQQQEQDSAQADRDQVKAKHDSWFGFTDKMAPLNKRRAVDALNKIVSWNRKVDERGALIAERVRAGWHVANDPRQGEVLQSPDGAYLPGKDVTKIGLQFANYLANHHH